MRAWDLETIGGNFAEAALDPSRWKHALEQVVSATSSYGAVLLPSTGGVLPTVPFTDEIHPSFETYMRDGWHLRDERNRGIPLMKRRGVIDDLDIFSREEIARHPYYQEFLAPHNLRWFAGVRVSCENDLWCLSLQRTIDQGPFSETEKNRLAELSKGLSGAVAIARGLGSSTAAGILEAFQISRTAAVLINRHGRIFEANEAAQRLLVGEIKIAKGQIVVANSPDATGALSGAIRTLLNRHDGGLCPPIALPRTGRVPILAHPTKLTRMTNNALADCQALLIFIDPDVGLRPAQASLQLLFRLSEAEARLAVQLASGEPLETVAERLGIAKETSRSQLKSIFAKTGTHRQAALVAMLAKVL